MFQGNRLEKAIVQGELTGQFTTARSAAHGMKNRRCINSIVINRVVPDRILVALSPGEAPEKMFSGIVLYRILCIIR